MDQVRALDRILTLKEKRIFELETALAAAHKELASLRKTLEERTSMMRMGKTQTSGAADPNVYT